MKKKKKKCSFKVYDGEKWLHGTAAFLKVASNAGGPDAFVEDIVRKATPIIIGEYNKPNIKIVK